MLADPQSITVNAIAKSMPRISNNNGFTSFYQNADQTFSLGIRHREVTRDKKKRIVSLASFTQRKVVADPLTAVNDFETLTESFQIDRPLVGFTATETDQQAQGFFDWANTAMITKLFGQES